MKQNEQQKAFIFGTEGIHLVYAGPGTGKTESIKERYVHILCEKKKKPSDILLLTFTENAAETMRRRIIEAVASKEEKEPPVPLSELVYAPLSTFHSFCADFIRRYGFRAPEYLGMKEALTEDFSVLDGDVSESDVFESFTVSFLKRHPEHRIFFVPREAGRHVFYLIRQLGSKGIFPVRRSGEKLWHGQGFRHLKGDLVRLKGILSRADEEGKAKSAARRLRARYERKVYCDELDLFSLVNGDALCMDKLEQAFYEDRSDFESFLHDISWEYIEHLVKAGRLSFDLLIIFAYLLLYENPSLRSDVQFDYVMVDEFQDTNELQFKIMILLSRGGNIAAVGDWKQGIYGFRFASTENILLFRERLERYKSELNEGYARIEYDVSTVTEHRFEINYRNTSRIIDFFNLTLSLPGTKDEEVVLPRALERLQAFDDEKPCEVFRLLAPARQEEMRLTLEKIRHILTSGCCSVRERQGEGFRDRAVRPGDIAVLSRTREYAMALQKWAFENAPDIPVRFEAGTELFRSEPAITVLAWLRLLSGRDEDRALAVILEKEGFGLQEIQDIVVRKNAPPPSDILALKDTWSRISDIRKLLGNILERYRERSAIFDSSYADVLVSRLAAAFDSAPLDMERLVLYMEKSLQARVTENVEQEAGRDSVTLQTIHAAKGLEYPIVFIADVNAAFPSKNNFSPVYLYDDILGVRMSKEYRIKNSQAYVFDRWQWDLLSSAIPRGEYDEERRLYYVAASRASQYLYITASSPSLFFSPENLPMPDIAGNRLAGKPFVKKEPLVERAVFRVSGTSEEIPRFVSVHQLMQIKSARFGGRGMAFGEKIHDLAARVVSGAQVQLPPEGSEERRDFDNVLSFLRDLKGKKIPEVDCLCPFEAGGKKIVIRGVIDLLVIGEDRIEVIDFKTDIGRDNHREYENQVSVYCSVVERAYPEKKVFGSIYYTFKGEKMQVNLRPLESFIDPVREDLGF